MTMEQILAVPPGFQGSLPEYIVHRTLTTRFKKIEGVDFFFQSPLMGGRMSRGGVVLDFLFANPPDLAINVQGEFFHYEKGVNVIARDRMARAQLAGRGITLIFVDEADVLEDPVRIVGDALRYVDHSNLGGGG